MTDSINLFSNYITIILLFVGIGIFSLLAVDSRKIKSFQFQISIFIVIWIAGEIIDLLQSLGEIESILPSDLGIKIHLMAMIFFCGMVLVRFYLAKQSGKTMIDDLQERSDDNQ
mgnify:FL=1